METVAAPEDLEYTEGEPLPVDEEALEAPGIPEEYETGVEETMTPQEDVESEVDAISALLDEAMARLADIQEQLPEDAQPIVTYLVDIIESIGDVIEFLFDNMIDEMGGSPADPELSEAVNVVADEAAARPSDARDTTMTLQHVPGVEDHHLTRVARFADNLTEALQRTRDLRERATANPEAYGPVFNQSQAQ
jgi:ABC-type transporter Mla subunit MlaD